MISEFKFSQLIEACRPGETPDWVDLSAPDERELAYVGERYGLPRWLFTDPLDPQEWPRVEHDNSMMSIVVRLSVQENTTEGILCRTIPAGIIIFPGLVVTVCQKAGLVTTHLRRLIQRQRHWTHISLAFALLHAAGSGYIENLTRMKELAGEAEARLRQSPENEELLSLLDIEKSLIDITTALKSNLALMDKIKQFKSENFKLTEDELDLLDDARIENQQAVFMAEIFGQVLSSMSEAFGSIISNNLNKTMKFMAGVTIVLTVPMIISGLFGMNVKLPGTEAGWAFSALCGLALMGMAAVSILFAKKKWF